jgi:hypothetical protein
MKSKTAVAEAARPHDPPVEAWQDKFRFGGRRRSGADRETKRP